MSKRGNQLFEYLVRIAQNIEESSELFVRELRNLSEPNALWKAIKNHETQGDTLTSELISLLNATYITPLDREDFLELAVCMDDIIDGLESCTVRFDLYSITTPTAVMEAFARNIHASCQEVCAAIIKLQAKKLMDIRQHTKKLDELEKQGDQILRDALRQLFVEATDTLVVIKYKEIYEILENITDRCKDVADALESVIVKNA